MMREPFGCVYAAAASVSEPAIKPRASVRPPCYDISTKVLQAHNCIELIICEQLP
jgi:hypothetical protein